MKSFRFPEPKEVSYSLPEGEIWYKMKTVPIGFHTLPERLKVEETQRPGQVQAGRIIKGPQKNGKTSFFTGIRETQHPDIFTGDRPGRERKSLIVFYFTADRRTLTVYYFRSFYPKGTNQLIEFIEAFQNRYKIY